MPDLFITDATDSSNEDSDDLVSRAARARGSRSNPPRAARAGGTGGVGAAAGRHTNSVHASNPSAAATALSVGHGISVEQGTSAANAPRLRTKVKRKAAAAVKESSVRRKGRRNRGTLSFLNDAVKSLFNLCMFQAVQIHEHRKRMMEHFQRLEAQQKAIMASMNIPHSPPRVFAPPSPLPSFENPWEDVDVGSESEVDDLAVEPSDPDDDAGDGDDAADDDE